MKFINHWKHKPMGHCIILGIQWGGGWTGERTIEFTILNFGIEFKMTKANEGV